MAIHLVSIGGYPSRPSAHASSAAHHQHGNNELTYIASKLVAAVIYNASTVDGTPAWTTFQDAVLEELQHHRVAAGGSAWATAANDVGVVQHIMRFALGCPIDVLNNPTPAIRRRPVTPPAWDPRREEDDDDEEQDTEEEEEEEEEESEEEESQEEDAPPAPEAPRRVGAKSARSFTAPRSSRGREPAPASTPARGRGSQGRGRASQGRGRARRE